MGPAKFVATKKSLAIVNSENNLPNKTINTRSSKLLLSSLQKDNIKGISVFPKRKAASPIKGKTLKRSALGNITNAIETKCLISSAKKVVKKHASSTLTKPTISTTAKMSQIAVLKPTINLPKSSPEVESLSVKSLLPPLPKTRLKPPTLPFPNARQNVNAAVTKQISTTTLIGKPVSTVPISQKSIKSPSVAKKPTNALIATSKPKITVKPKGMVHTFPNTRRSSGRRSTIDSCDSSLYTSALSDVLDDIPSNEVQEKLPKPLINIDEEYINDPHQCAVYAYEIFDYLKSREEHFKINEYMLKQPGLSSQMRAILVDWMVEIQESFELNHETLYLGVKLVDAYLAKVRVCKLKLQLLGATSMLLAAKYDERIPPSIDDFLYICNEAYERKDVIKMEYSVLRTVNFELGFPLSYRFLRRYARCAKVPMPLLTLARYILELSLMDYCTVTLSDSKLAAAALYLAFKMKKEHSWDDTLIYFSGYNVEDFIDVAYVLNSCLHQKPKQSLSTVRNKYSHQVFYEVAKIPLVSNEDL